MGRLDVAFIDLASKSNLAPYVNMASFRRLELFECSEIMPFLVSLTPLGSSCKLKELDVTRPTRSEDLTQALEDLLNSFTGSQYLWINTGDSGLIDVSCISRHGATLCQLGSYSKNTASKHLNVSDLAAIVFACPCLEGLAVAFCDIELDGIQALGADFQLQTGPYLVGVPNQIKALLVRTKDMVRNNLLLTLPFSRTRSHVTPGYTHCACCPCQTSSTENRQTPQHRILSVSQMRKYSQHKLSCINLQ